MFLCFSILLTLKGLGKERASLGAFCTLFDVRLFGFVSLVLFSLPLGVWEGLRFVIVLWHSLDFYLTFFLTLALMLIEKNRQRVGIAHLLSISSNTNCCDLKAMKQSYVFWRKNVHNTG